MANKLSPVHPGEILREEFLAPLGLNGQQLARALHLRPTQIAAILKERGSISSATALRLARLFHTTPEFWLNLQIRFDLEVAERADGAKVRREVIPLRA